MKQIPTPKALIDNFKCIEGSFIYFLHEMAEFNELAFWEYYNSIVELTNLTKDYKTLDREITDMVCHTYSFTIRSLLWNFHPRDVYTISNLPKEELSSYVERLEFAFNGFIKGHIFEDEIFELENPKYKQND